MASTGFRLKAPIVIIGVLTMFCIVLLWKETSPGVLNVDPAHAKKCHSEPTSICELYGLQGPLKPNALATIVATAIVTKEEDYRISNVWYAWRRLDQVNFVVLSNNCDVLRRAHEANLPTLRVSSGNELRDLTVFHMFEMADRYATTPLVGFVNGDIAFDERLPETLSAVLEEREQHPEVWKDFFLVGKRSNVNIPDHYLHNRLQNESEWLGLQAHMTQTGIYAKHGMDYFIFNKGINITWGELPPFFVGGVRFDGWIAGYVRERRDIQMVDTTETLRAFHCNHGSNRKESENSLMSEMNVDTLDRYGGWWYGGGRGRTNDGNWKSRYDDETSQVRFFLKPIH